MGQRRTGHLLKGIDKMKTQRLMTLLAVTLSLSFFVSGQEAKHKKLIGFDHSTPTPLFLKKNIAEMEKYAPYDGIGIRVATSGKVNGKTINCSGWTVCSNIPWKYEWFADMSRPCRRLNSKNSNIIFCAQRSIPAHSLCSPIRTGLPQAIISPYCQRLQKKAD